ncbi:protein CLT3, chloroplastic-like [Vigna umbellata]|uniref:protein CLT3, chloroplastic-like n=1 Tax=Vigna umbellata TaxID=87088 RepID=UPI001F5F2F12|nr:protein CLT3, chloroplastic-like [Vigna umbellata]
MIVSFLFQAADTVLKEIIFLNATQKLKGGSLDMFVVNSFGSAFQALFICLLLPFLSKLWGIPFSQLPNYLKDGTACFLNVGTLSRGKQLSSFPYSHFLQKVITEDFLLVIKWCFLRIKVHQ